MLDKDLAVRRWISLKYGVIRRPGRRCNTSWLLHPIKRACIDIEGTLWVSTMAKNITNEDEVCKRVKESTSHLHLWQNMALWWLQQVPILANLKEEKDSYRGLEPPNGHSVNTKGYHNRHYGHHVPREVLDTHIHHTHHPRMQWLLLQGKKGWTWTLLLTVVGM